MAQGWEQAFLNTAAQTETFLWQDVFKAGRKNGKKGGGRLLIEVMALQAWKQRSMISKGPSFNQAEQILGVNILCISLISQGKSLYYYIRIKVVYMSFISQHSYRDLECLELTDLYMYSILFNID